LTAGLLHPGCITILKTLIIATVLLPKLAMGSNPCTYRNRDSA
jgi:hypothetical protein